MKNKCSILAVANQKGGCSKSTTVTSLASAFARLGKKVLVVDFDFQGNSSDWLGMKDKAVAEGRTVTTAVQKGLSIADVRMHTKDENIDIICSDFSLNWEVRKLNGTSRQFQLLKKILDCPESEDYHVILIDSNPAIDPLFESIMGYADYFLVPVFAEKHPYSGLEYLTKAVEQIKEDVNPMLHFLGLVITKYNKKNATHKKFEKKLRELQSVTHVPVLDTLIPTSEAVAGASARQQTLIEYDASLPVSQAYMALAEELLPMLKGRRTGRPKKQAVISRASKTSFDQAFEEASF